MMLRYIWRLLGNAYGRGDTSSLGKQETLLG